MDILKLFTREEPIAGLEISDDFIRLTLLQTKKGDKKNQSVTEIKFLCEEALPENCIIEGIIGDKKILLKSLQNLLKKSGSNIKCAVISIPSNLTYSKIFSFPKNIQEEKLKDTMELAIGFQLPIKPEESYLDWEKVENPSANEVFLAAAKKTTIDSYIDVLNLAGLKTIAVEFHPLSIIRTMVVDEKPKLFKTVSKNATNIFIFKSKDIKFSRTIPNKFISKKSIDDEIKKISDFYESGDGQIDKIIDLNQIQLIDGFEDQLKNKFKETGEEKSRWFISLGAAIRGLMPRSDDNLISLMPIGTKETYEYQRAIIFSEFISNVTIGISIFFVAIFFTGWMLMLSVQQNISKQLEGLSSLPMPSDATALENEAKKLNNIVNISANLLKNIPSWSIVFDELKTRAVQDIIISNISLPSPEGIYAINGTAKNRSQLNVFKKSLEESQIFTNITLPLTNLEQKGNIPFSITMQLKNPQILLDN
jgi:Tfp pilus assembly PilM family ATPase